MKTISLAYSPDTDDAFMVNALREGLIDTGDYRFELISADIQELNEKARQGVYDVTAISVAAYPSISQEYLMMPIGASIGDAFGPAIIVRKDSKIKDVAELQQKVIAVPGRETSAFFAARGLIGNFDERPMPFYEIAGAVADGKVDAGILIHELQLNCEEQGFRKLGDLGSLWTQQYGLPLPLGANAIKRGLGEKAVADITRIYRESIEYGLANRQATLTNALARAMAKLNDGLGDRYIDMYVNHRSLELHDDVRQAIEKLFAIGAAAGLSPRFDLQSYICS